MTQPPLPAPIHSKYSGIREDNHTGKLLWPGIDGIPLRIDQHAAPPLLRRQELDAAEIIYDAYVKIFDLAKPADLEEYSSIIDRAANGWYKIEYRDRQYNPARGSYVVLVEWLQLYGELPRPKTLVPEAGPKLLEQTDATKPISLQPPQNGADAASAGSRSVGESAQHPPILFTGTGAQ